jgi:hypothetical protein
VPKNSTKKSNQQKIAALKEGSIYKYGKNSRMYILHKGELGLPARAGIPQKTLIHACDLKKTVDVGPLKLTNANMFGSEIEMPLNKEEWGINILFKILAVECLFLQNILYKKYSETGKRILYNKMSTLYSEVYSCINNKQRSLKKYKEFLAKKNSIFILIPRKKSNSRGAYQRKHRFDIKDKYVELPWGTEGPGPVILMDGTPYKGNDNAFLRIKMTPKWLNYLGLSYHQFLNADLYTEYHNKITTKIPRGPIKISRGTFKEEPYLQWLGIKNKKEYQILEIDDEEYFPNAALQDRNYYIKPYGWPELYKGRLRIIQEVKALQGKKNIKGLRYIPWLQRRPGHIANLCGHFIKKGGAEEFLSCSRCAKTRYCYWDRGH